MKLLFCLLISISLFAKEVEPPNEVAKLSEAIGHLIAKDLQQRGIPIDFDALVRGFQGRASGKKAPLSDEECLDAITAFQEKALQQLTEKNLNEAVAFLKENAKKEKIVTLEEGKLQIQVVKEGSGEIVQSYNSPILRYKGSYLNGESFGASAGEEMISLDDTIPGFSKAIIGMHEGEVRTLYIHPELGYGSADPSMPNALLIFEVELIKADASAQAQAAANSEDLVRPEPFFLR